MDQTLRLLADMQKRECVAKALGPEVVTRMEEPLAAGRRALQQSVATDEREATYGRTASISPGLPV